MTCAAIVLAALACRNDLTTENTPSVCSPGSAASISLASGGYVSLDPAGSSGCFEIGGNSTGDSALYLIVPWSAAFSPGVEAPFALRSGGTATARISARVGDAGTRHFSARASFDARLRAMARAHVYPAARPTGIPRAAPTTPPVAAPPAVGSLRSFVVCAAQDCSTTSQVVGRVQALGAHVAIYVDTTAPAGGLNAADLDTLRNEFDTRLYVIDTTTFGSVSDEDQNSVVVVLMTGAVNRLTTKAECDSAGSIAGFFFPGDLDQSAAGQFNDGEIFYTLVADPSGTLSCAYTRNDVKQLSPVSFIHEFQHMINFNQHVLLRHGDPEEGWLDEGLSKYAEEVYARSFLSLSPPDSSSFSRYAVENLYDAYIYLEDTGDFPLLTPEEDESLESLGASWLFVRYLVDHFGSDIPRRLEQTTATGGANVAVQTGQPFANVVSRWSLANYVSGISGVNVPPELQYTSWNFRGVFQSLFTQDPQDFPAPFPVIPTRSALNEVAISGTLHAGSGAYHRAGQGGGAGAVTLLFTANGTTPISPDLVPRLNVFRLK